MYICVCLCVQEWFAADVEDDTQTTTSSAVHAAARMAIGMGGVGAFCMDYYMSFKYVLCVWLTRVT